MPDGLGEPAVGGGPVPGFSGDLATDAQAEIAVHGCRGDHGLGARDVAGPRLGQGLERPDPDGQEQTQEPLLVLAVGEPSIDLAGIGQGGGPVAPLGRSPIGRQGEEGVDGVGLEEDGVFLRAQRGHDRPSRRRIVAQVIGGGGQGVGQGAELHGVIDPGGQHPVAGGQSLIAEQGGQPGGGDQTVLLEIGFGGLLRGLAGPELQVAGDVQGDLVVASQGLLARQRDLGLDGGVAAEGEGLARMDAGRGEVAMIVQVEGGPPGIGPAVLAGRAMRGQVGDDGEGLVDAGVLVQVLGEAIGLAVAVDGLGRLLLQGVEIGRRALEGLGRIIAQAGGDGDARGRVVDLAGDVAGVAQAVAQQLLQLAEGQPGLGDLQLDVVAPVVLEGVGRAVRPGGRLHGLELVEEAGGDHLAGQAAAGQVGRDREGVDHQAMVVVGLPGGDGEDEDNGGAETDAEGLQGQ